MDRNKFIQGSTRIRVMEKTLLTDESLKRLLEANSLDESLKLLQDSIYQNAINSLENKRDYEYILKQELLKTFKDLYEISPEKEEVDVLALKYFYHNLKVLLKESILKNDFRDLYILIGNFDLNKFRENIEEKSSVVSDDRFEKYLKVIEGARSVYEESKDPQDIDIFIDKKYIEDLLKSADKTEVPLIKDFVKYTIDFTNIKTFLRVKDKKVTEEFLDKILFDGGSIDKGTYFKFINEEITKDLRLWSSSRFSKNVSKGVEEFIKTGSLSGFETEMDNFLMGIVKETKRVTYGPEVLFGYGYAKEIEIKNLRLILISKLNEIKSSNLKERLRESYV